MKLLGEPAFLSTIDIQFEALEHKALFDRFKTLFQEYQSKRSVLFVEPGCYTFECSGSHMKGDAVSTFTEREIKG